MCCQTSRPLPNSYQTTRHTVSKEFTWLNGKRDHIPGFVSQREAQRWIEEKSPIWLSAHSRGARASFSGLATALSLLSQRRRRQTSLEQPTLNPRNCATRQSRCRLGALQGRFSLQI